MAFTDDELKQIGQVIGEEVRMAIGPILTQQRKGIPDSVSDYRGLNYLTKKIGDIEYTTKQILRDRNLANKDFRASTSLIGRMFKESNDNLREIQYQKNRVTDTDKKTEEEIKKLAKVLEDKFNVSGVNDKNALQKAGETFNKLTKDINDTRKELNNLKSSSKELVDKKLSSKRLSKKKKEELANALNDKETFSKLYDKDGKLDTEALKAIVEMFKEIAGYKIFSEKDVKLFAQINKEEDELNDKLETQKGLGKEYTGVLSQQTDALREHARLANISIGTIKNGINGIATGVKSFVKSFGDAWRKVDQSSANFAKNIGIGNKGLEALRTNTMNLVKNGIGVNYGIGMEELIQVQQGYAQGTGRNIGLSNEDIEYGAAMSRVMGQRGGELANALEKFGLSYSEAGKRAGKMFSDASKYGLSFEKYSENFLQNIKIAQNYTFRDGLKGLERMAKKATEIRLDMQQVASFADKVSTLEGSIEASAQLQVLGGAYAQFSDPLGMLNDSLNNVGGIMDRIENMTKNIGTFNAKTGEVEISAFERQRAKVAAGAMGMDYNQMMESIQTQARRNFIERNIRGNFTDEEREFLLNTATVSNGTPQMTYIDKNGNRVTKDVNRMSSEDIKQARTQNESDSDNIKTIARSTMSLNEKVEGVEKAIQATEAKFVDPIMNFLDKKLMSNLNLIKFAVIAIAGANIITQGGQILKSVFGGISNIFGGIGGFAKAVSGGGKIVGEAVPGMTGAGNGLLKLTKGNVAGGLIGAGISYGTNKLIDNGTMKRGGFGDYAGHMLGNTVSYASIGSMLGPIGTAVGAALGLASGALTATKNKRKQDIYDKHGVDVHGSYAAFRLKEIKEALETGEVSDNLRKKLEARGDKELLSKIDSIKNQTVNTDTQTTNAQVVYLNYDEIGNTAQKARGGLLNGPSHLQGGMPIVGSNIEVEGGEYVVNKNATQKNLGLLNSINSMSGGGIIKPVEGNGIKPMFVAPITQKSFSESYSQTKIAPIDVKINGTIKLDAGNGNEVNLNALLKDPVFISQITKLIEQQMTFNTTGSRRTDKLV